MSVLWADGTPCAFVGCEIGLWRPFDATGRVGRGLGLPQGFRSFGVNDSTASGRDTRHVGGGVACTLTCFRRSCLFRSSKFNVQCSKLL